MIEKIIHNKKIFALIVKGKKYKKKRGINFFTKKSFPLQVAHMSHKKNHNIKPHIHFKRLKKIYQTAEVLIILSGVLRVDFYTNKKKYVKSKELVKNDILILLNGGHGFFLKKNCTFIEVKQGPFFPDKDKKKI